MAEDSSNDEGDVEDRMYALLHYVDGSAAQINASTPPQLNPVITPLENGIRRYWKTPEQSHIKSQFQKINKKSDNVVANTNKSKHVKVEADNLKNVDNSFSTPVSSDAVRSIEIEETETPKNVTVLESSDDDEVVEIALPPQPTITIESSEEDDVVPVIVDLKQGKKDKSHLKTVQKKKKKKSKDREVSASPVPSVVSSISDDFIRGDCVAFNITSKQKETQNFNFNLHGTDLADHTLNNEISNISKKKKKDKSKKTTSTPKRNDTFTTDTRTDMDIFATPKNKEKNKKKRKYQVSNISVPEPDIYESDSSQSMPSDIAETIVKKNNLVEEIITNDNAVDKIIADISADDITNKIVEAEIENIILLDQQSNQINSITLFDELSNHKEKDNAAIEDEKSDDKKLTPSPKGNIIDLSLADENHSPKQTVDLTGCDEHIETDIIMGNVSYSEPKQLQSLPFCEIVEASNSTKGLYKPVILHQNLDFNDANKCKIFLPSSLKNDMNRFYSESWGGEDFDHEALKRSMSRDKSLWQIDNRDRMMPGKKQQRCSYCKLNHREEQCYRRPKICFMCGLNGHLEPRCPQKMCVNCGKPNYIYTAKCRHCSSWPHVFCTECKRRGHPADYCPDLWRRYHYTVDHTEHLIEERDEKHGNKAHCSGCAQTGHFVHACNNYITFTTLPLFNPYVYNYSPVYAPLPNTLTTKNMIGDQPNSSIIKNNDHKRAFQGPQNIPTMNTTNKVNTYDNRRINQKESESNRNTFNRGENRNFCFDPTKIRPLMSSDHSKMQHAGLAYSEQPSNRSFDSRQPYHVGNIRTDNPPVRINEKNYSNKRPYQDEYQFSIHQNNSPYNKRASQRRFVEEGQSKRFDNKIINQANNDKFGEFPPIQIVVNNNFNEPDRQNQGSMRPQIDRSSNFTQQNIHGEDNIQLYERHKRTISETSGISDAKKRRRTTSSPNQSSIVDSTTSSLEPDKGINDSNRGFYTGLIFVEDSVLNAINTRGGKNWLKTKCTQLDLSVTVKVDPVPALEVKGSTRNQEIFQKELRKWSGWEKRNENITMPLTLSKNKKSTLEMIEKDLKQLQSVKFNARQLKNDFTYNNQLHDRLLQKKKVSETKLMNSRRRINECNKSINMLLLGQAGFASGHQHLRRLISLKENLQKLPGDTVPEMLLNDLRKGYEPIFGSKPRNDYEELFRQYHAKPNNFQKFIEIMKTNTIIPNQKTGKDEGLMARVENALVVQQAPDYQLHELKQWRSKLLNTCVKQKKTRNKFLKQIVDAIKKWPLLGNKEHYALLNQVKHFLKQ